MRKKRYSTNAKELAYGTTGAVIGGAIGSVPGALIGGALGYTIYNLRKEDKKVKEKILKYKK